MRKKTARRFLSRNEWKWHVWNLSGAGSPSFVRRYESCINLLFVRTYKELSPWERICNMFQGMF